MLIMTQMVADAGTECVMSDDTGDNGREAASNPVNTNWGSSRKSSLSRLSVQTSGTCLYSGSVLKGY